MANLKDVAKEAGVSVITVSRVVNTPEKVKESTRNRVSRAMKELGYQSNFAAKALVTNQTRTIHLLLPSRLTPEQSYTMGLIAGITDTLSKSYYSVLIRRTWEFPYKCDGIIAMGLKNGEDDKLLKEVDTPIVLFGKSERDLDWIDIDNAKGTYEMTKLMVRQGHMKIGFMQMDVNEAFSNERYTGYLKAMEGEGFIVSKDMFFTVEHEESAAFEKALEILKTKRLTALVCTSDVIALGVLRAARKLGIHVPRDFSIGGFDGYFNDLIADPPLTTVYQPVYEIGQKLARQMLERIKDPSLPYIRENIVPKLIVRKTVAGVPL